MVEARVDTGPCGKEDINKPRVVKVYASLAEVRGGEELAIGSAEVSQFVLTEKFRNREWPGVPLRVLWTRARPPAVWRRLWIRTTDDKPICGRDCREQNCVNDTADLENIEISSAEARDSVGRLQYFVVSATCRCGWRPRPS
jgi:hypothetical protein